MQKSENEIVAFMISIWGEHFGGPARFWKEALLFFNCFETVLEHLGSGNAIFGGQETNRGISGK